MNLFFALVLSLAAICYAGNCTNGEKPVDLTDSSKYIAPTDGSCAFYNKETCCVDGITPINGVDRVDIRTQVVDKPACKMENHQNCYERSNFASCGENCGPDSAKYQDSTTGNFRICKSFASDMYDECKKNEMWDSADENKCRKVSDVYPELENFTDALGWQIETSDCWGASSSLSVAFGAVLALSLLLW